MPKLTPRPASVIQESSGLMIYQVYQKFNQDITKKKVTSLEMKPGRPTPSCFLSFPPFLILSFTLDINNFWSCYYHLGSLLDPSGIVRWSGLETNLTCPRTWDLFHNLSGWPGVCLSHFSEYPIYKELIVIADHLIDLVFFSKYFAHHG